MKEETKWHISIANGTKELEYITTMSPEMALRMVKAIELLLKSLALLKDNIGKENDIAFIEDIEKRIESIMRGDE